MEATKTKKKEHTGFRNGNFFCFNCGGEYNPHLPQPVDMMSAMLKQFAKTHKNCAKTWIEPVAETEGKTEKENADWWAKHGEQGISSKTMFKYLDGRDLLTGRECTPSDPDDFRRCYLLLKAVPQWKAKLHLLKPLSPAWSNLVDNWDKLTEMLEDLMVKKKDNGMYDFMQTLLK